MIRPSVSCPTILALLALGSAANAQMVVTTNTTSDAVVGYSPVDGSLVEPFVFAVTDIVQVSAIAVGNEVWVSGQIPDRITRYDHGGNVIGVIGPTFPGGGLDNPRGMALIGGTVYVCNAEGDDHGATANSLVCFDTSGNHLTTLPLSNSPSPFGVLPWQGDLLVTSSSGSNDVHRYTMAGASVGLFHNSGTLSFAHQISPASDGNLWCASSSSNNVVKLDATTGAVLTSFTASSARGVFELQNGNVLWAGQAGVHVYDVSTLTSTLIHAGSSYQLNVIPTGISFHRKYGTGCHAYSEDHSNLFQQFLTVAAAETALEGNAMQFLMTSNGYVANWLAGQAAALYVPPTGGATIVVSTDGTANTFLPSAPIPIPGGTAAKWTISSEGILTASDFGNNEVASTASLSIIDTAEAVGFYSWTNLNPAETGSGKVKWEEILGVLYVTFDGVELSGTGAHPSTFQFQVDMTSGEVRMVWLSMFGTGSTSTSDVTVGCTLAGTGFVPVSQTLTGLTGHVIEPDPSLMLKLSAAPAPVINPSTNVTYTIDNIPETAPGSGLYLSLMFLSVNPLPVGIDLTGILTTVPGCSLYLGTLDLGMGAAVTVVPQNLVPFTFSTPVFSPGNLIGAQAIALFDATFPLVNGEASGYLVSNPVLTATYVQ